VRVLVGAFGDPGHAFPALALGRALRRAGHAVVLETWERWRPHALAEGLEFAPAPEYHVFPTAERPLKPYQAVARATGVTRELVRAAAPDVVVADILTLAPALAAELEGVPVATLIPHVDPRPSPGFPPYSVGARLPRTRAGARLWTALDPLVGRGLELGRRELNETRRRLGLPAQDHVHGGISRGLSLVATLPQLEYPRPGGGAPGRVVTGPLLWEPPTAPVGLPPGDEPLVLVAPSTSQDPEHRMLRAALDALGTLPVRVLATGTRRDAGRPLGPVPPNATIVDWLSYEQVMPHCDVVVCHAGHGTVARALAGGAVVVACPAAGDMNENAARIAWAGCGVRLPRRLVAPRPLRLAVRRALDEPGLRARALELARWSAAHDAGARAVAAIEEYVA
jgi:UDP:flavonoid glycosyltransferase YjiC (YdhE family)